MVIGVAVSSGNLGYKWLRNHGVGQSLCQAVGLTKELGEWFAFWYD